jgi:hypothetical protein
LCSGLAARLGPNGTPAELPADVKGRAPFQRLMKAERMGSPVRALHACCLRMLHFFNTAFIAHIVPIYTFTLACMAGKSGGQSPHITKGPKLSHMLLHLEIRLPVLPKAQAPPLAHSKRSAYLRSLMSFFPPFPVK